MLRFEIFTDSKFSMYEMVGMFKKAGMVGLHGRRGMASSELGKLGNFWRRHWQDGWPVIGSDWPSGWVARERAATRWASRAAAALAGSAARGSCDRMSGIGGAGSSGTGGTGSA